MTEQTQDTAAIAAVLQSYIDGIKATKAQNMREIFHEDATISRQKPDGFVITPKFRDMIAGFLESCTPIHETSPDFGGEIVSIDHVEDVGSARILEKNLDGHDFHTFFLLHKVDGRWLISSKATQAVAA